MSDIHTPYTPSTARLEAFSDAVIAIILTLLVLELKIPELTFQASPHEMLDALTTMWPKFVSFTLSFLIISIFWVNHHQFFHLLDHANRGILWLNNLLLFWLCFIPFPAALLGEHPSNIVSVMLFGSVLFLAATSFSIMAYYAHFCTHLIHSLEMHQRKTLWRRNLVGVTLYGLSVLIAPLSITIAEIIFVIVPVFYFIPTRIFKNG